MIWIAACVGYVGVGAASAWLMGYLVAGWPNRCGPTISNNDLASSWVVALTWPVMLPCILVVEIVGNGRIPIRALAASGYATRKARAARRAMP